MSLRPRRWTRRAQLARAIVLLSVASCGTESRRDGVSADDAGSRDDAMSNDAMSDDSPEQPLVDAATEPPEGSVVGGFRWQLPARWPRPPVPSDNPMSNEKVELGRHLFYDGRLSANESTACFSCHKQEIAFTDGRPVAIGSTGQLHTRGSMSLANVGYAQTLTWGHPALFALEEQLLAPLFGDQPEELANKSTTDLEARLAAVPRYTELFAAAFPEDAQPIVLRNVQRALAAFQRTLVSGNSDYDRYQRGEADALSASAERGMRLIASDQDVRFQCVHCHGSIFFTDHATWEGRNGGESAPYHQTGLYDVDGQGGYPAPNTGTHSVTGRPEDMGMFKAPTLRNIALTAPYMHDGSIATLSEVLDHYARGGRAAVAGRTDARLKPFSISNEERADIVAFLESLTDHEFVSDPRFSDPWRTEGR